MSEIVTPTFVTNAKLTVGLKGSLPSQCATKSHPCMCLHVQYGICWYRYISGCPSHRGRFMRAQRMKAKTGSRGARVSMGGQADVLVCGCKGRKRGRMTLGDSHSISHAIVLIKKMVQHGGNMCHDAVQVLVTLMILSTKSHGLGQARPEPSHEWGLWLGPAFEKAKAPSGQAKAMAFGPSQAGTTLAQGALPTKSFRMYLAQNYSELYLGGTNNKLHKGNFTYLPLTHKVRSCREVSQFGVNIYTLQGYCISKTT